MKRSDIAAQQAGHVQQVDGVEHLVDLPDEEALVEPRIYDMGLDPVAKRLHAELSTTDNALDGVHRCEHPDVAIEYLVYVLPELLLVEIGRENRPLLVLCQVIGQDCLGYCRRNTVYSGL